jgi:hypothetical protein
MTAIPTLGKKVNSLLNHAALFVAQLHLDFTAFVITHETHGIKAC